MKDIQKQIDYRNIPINKVGIKGLKYPITVLDRNNGSQATVAEINMYVDLPHQHKGTHMSRFVEMLHEYRPNFSLKSFEAILNRMKSCLNAESSDIEITFPYFIEKKAPVSAAPSLMNYSCCFKGSSGPGGEIDIVMEVVVPISSVCPCSKEISDVGAHNQRGEVRLGARFKNKKFVWIEDMIQLVEKQASCDVFSVLKRVDEKFVTEKAFENPKFVEDIVRDIALDLLEHDDVAWFEVSVENFESIHNHSAYAYVTNGVQSVNY